MDFTHWNITREDWAPSRLINVAVENHLRGGFHRDEIHSGRPATNTVITEPSVIVALTAERQADGPPDWQTRAVIVPAVGFYVLVLSS